jgi:phosphoenolpyruvate synthase/pyruvate phosphate dikinase
VIGKSEAASQGDREKHVYVSVGHQQMMTDAMRPLGLSVWQHTTQRPMAEAGGRLFVDVTRILASPSSRAGFLDLAGRSDPLIRDALQSVIDRGDLIPSEPDRPAGAGPTGRPAGDSWPGWVSEPIEADPAIVTDLIARSVASIETLKGEIRGRTATDLLDFILADLGELRRLLADPQSYQVIMAGMEATWWLKDRLSEWLGENDAADTLTQSVPNNVTSEMGLALLDVADAIRPNAAVVTYLERAEDDGFLDGLVSIDGGPQARAAISAWLDRYGMRCVGEIDITRPRWSERPTALVPILLGNVRSFQPGAGQLRFERGLEEAGRAELDVLERLRGLPGGAKKASEARRMIDRVRTFAGYREYPKYAMISRYFVYKQALLAEADRLVRTGVLGDREDIFFLTLPEIREVLGTGQAVESLIGVRMDTFRSYQALTPPRVLTSDGEAFSGAYRWDDVPTGALVGLAVSAGIVEGRARVILDMADADLERGDILVTAATDPSWTPLFVTIGGLVTEVGGLMTHGAVIAREYGLPSVVGVEHATTLIQDGQRVRVHGMDGFVELLS